MCGVQGRGLGSWGGGEEQGRGLGSYGGGSAGKGDR